MTWKGSAHRTRKTERTRTNYVSNEIYCWFPGEHGNAFTYLYYVLNGICIFVCDAMCKLWVCLFCCLFVCLSVCLVFTVFPTINKKELDISMKRGVMFMS